MSTDPALEKEKFAFYKGLIEKWDNPSTIGAFAFTVVLTVVLVLSFFEIAKISEAVQIFIIGVIMFILVFRYFKELTVGAIVAKPGVPIRINAGDKHYYGVRPAYANLDDDNPTMPKGYQQKR